jgi:hypothetical protein
MSDMPGSRLLRANTYGTALFLITALSGTIHEGFPRTVAAVVASVLFTIGCAVFLWALWLAIQRSRTEAIGMGGLFFLLEPVAPRLVRRPFSVLLAVQFLVGLAAAAATFNVKPFTPLAFGVLVPMFGLGFSGLWAAKYGSFGARERAKTAQPAKQ